MTLILNEIHLLKGLEQTMIVAAADRRLLKQDGTYGSTRKKLFRVPYLNGAVSYFGVAEVHGPSGRQFMSDWLDKFVNTNSSLRSLETFSKALRDGLHRAIPRDVLAKNCSGFHICGFNASGYPDLWHFSNVGQLMDFEYKNPQPQYGEAQSQFLEQHARTCMQWDGEDPLSASSGRIMTYRNGDYRAHQAAWKKLDEVFSELVQFPDFVQLTSLEEYGKYVKFKLKFIADFYAKWAKHQMIGTPIDVLVIDSRYNTYSC